MLCACAACSPSDFSSLTGKATELDASSSATDECLREAGSAFDASRCAPQPEPDAQACAPCLADAQTCNACDAGFSCASASAECEAGKRETETQPCGACNTGTQTRTRECSSDTCTWAAWSTWGECSGVTAICAPGDSAACENGDSCGHRVCDESCSWGACEPIQPDGCLRIRSGHTDQGSNYRCCGTGRWQFCLPDCHWGNSCVACAEGAPDYCSDCY